MIITPIASGSTGNCYHVTDGKTAILLDAGVSVRDLRKYGVMPSKIDACFVTHSHKDHCKAATELQRLGVQIFAGAQVFEEGGLSARGGTFPVFPDFDCSSIVGTFKITTFPVMHDVPNWGFYLQNRVTNESLLYYTDTPYIDRRFPRLDYVIAEANYDPQILKQNVASGAIHESLAKRVVKNHSSIETLLLTLSRHKLDHLKQVYIAHLSNGNSDEAAFRRRVQALTGAEVYVCDSHAHEALVSAAW